MSVYDEPGQNDRTYTISGFIPDAAGLLLTPQPEPIALKVHHTRNKWRSAAWWASAWMPQPWREWLCDRFGHPQSCMNSIVYQNVVAARMAARQDEMSFELTGIDNAAVDRWCHRCGWHGI